MWYDLREDWSLIESSIAKQYGLRIRSHTDMPWSEFCNLVSGLMPDTPLGQIVGIRSEKDKKVIKSFNSNQRRIHNEWKKRQASNKLKDPESLQKEMDSIGNMLSLMFKKRGE